MKKLLAVLFVAVLVLTMAVSASAEYYNPGYYGVLKAEAGAITVDGAVDEAYGDPIFYFLADGDIDSVGDYTSPSNWFFTDASSENQDDVLALVLAEENYAKGYAVWTDESIFFCVDVNILGWSMPASKTPADMWTAFCVQLCMFDTNAGTYTDMVMGINEAGQTMVRSGGTIPTLQTDDKDPYDLLDINAKVTREGDHVVYEVEVPFDRLLSFMPVEGDQMGLNVNISFSDTDENGKLNKKFLTFIQPIPGNNYHDRKVDTAAPLYFVTDVNDATEKYVVVANAPEYKQAEKDDVTSISLFGCNEVPAGTDFVLDSSRRAEEQTAGFGCLLLNVGTAAGKSVTNNGFAITPVDGTGYDSLEFMLELTDLALLDSATGSIVLSSGGSADANAISWSLADLKSVKDGGKNQGGALKAGAWNHIVLPIPTTGDFDISNVNYMEINIENNALERAALTIDNMRLSNAQEVLLAESQKDAEKVNERIGKLDDVTEKNLSTMKVKVGNARNAYEKLDDMAKTFVSAEMLAKLEALEQKIYDLENGVTEDPVDPVDPVEPVDPKPADPKPVTPAPAKSNNTVLIVVIVAVVVVAAAAAVVVVLKKKK